MSILAVILEALIFASLFTVLCFATTGGNNTAQVYNYPPEIQEEYFKTHERVPVAPFSKQVLLKKSMAVVFFSVLLVLMGYIAGARTFSQDFGFAFGMMLWIGVYDTFFLDWVLFANMKRFRLEGTEHMDKAYHQKWFHLKGMLFSGIIFALIPSVLVGLVIKLIG